MKVWLKPSVLNLEISATAQGKNIAASFDEIRVDQYGNYWVSFASGTDSKPDLKGKIIVGDDGGVILP